MLSSHLALPREGHLQQVYHIFAEPRGNLVSTHCFVDADHAGNRVTRRSQTGILIFINRAAAFWYSKGLAYVPGGRTDPPAGGQSWI